MLYYYVSLKEFSEISWDSTGTVPSFVLPAVEVMHAVKEEEVNYGLSVLRESIGEYEEVNGIPGEQSKRSIPFFMENTRTLVGPDTGMYMIPLYERPDLPYVCDEPVLVLEFDYFNLGEHILLNNLFLLQCKYNREWAIQEFLSRLNREYNKFFFDEEYTGFTSDSRFSMLFFTACLELRDPVLKEEKEWRLACLKSPEEVLYRYSNGDLIPYTPISIPLDCLQRVYLRGVKEHPLLHGTLIGFLKSKGLPAESLLDLS